MIFQPETPYWYLLKQKYSEAEKTLNWLRGSSPQTQSELTLMKQKLNEIDEDISYAEFLKSRTRKPLAISLFVHTVQQLCGGNILLMYTIQIYKQSETGIDNNLATVLTGVMQVVGNILSILFLDIFGRKSLLSASAFGIGLMTLPLGYYFLTLEHNVGSPLPDWLPVFFVCAIIFSYCLGCRGIPWLIPSELFNTRVRSKATSFGCMFNRSLHIIVVQVYIIFIQRF